MTALIALYVLAGLMILIGLLGTFLPILPGIPLMFLGMLLAAWAGDFQLIGSGTLTVLAIATVASIAIDLLATLIGAKRVGASRKAMLGAGVGGIVGLFFGLPGLLAGPYLGAMTGEMAHGSKWQHASRVGVGTWVGLIVGAVLKMGLAVSMLVVFVAALGLP